MDIIDHDASKCKTPLEVVLSLRRECLFQDNVTNDMSQFDPYARDPFEHLYAFYGVSERVGMGKNGATDTVWTRMRALWWTLNSMWFIAGPFDPDGCLRVPALVNPMEWTYAIALKLVWDGVKVECHHEATWSVALRLRLKVFPKILKILTFSALTSLTVFVLCLYDVSWC